MRLLFIAIFSFFTLTLVAIDEQNRMIPCEHGLIMYSWDLAFIKEAKESIEMSLCFTGGTVFTTLMNAFEDRLETQKNLKVHIIVAPVLMVDADRARLDGMKEKYGNRFCFLITGPIPVTSPDIASIENHVKVLVVDGYYFSLGGSNFDESMLTEGTYTPPRSTSGTLARNHLPAGVRDQDIVGSGPIAQDIRRMFFKLFAVWAHYEKHPSHYIHDQDFFEENDHYFALLNEERAYVPEFENSKLKIVPKSVKLVASKPFETPNRIATEYIDLIGKAKSEIVIANLYFNPPSDVLGAIMGSINRNVTLTLITNGNYSDSPFYNQFYVWATRINYLPLFYGKEYRFYDFWLIDREPKTSTHVYEYHVADILYHKKMILIDGRYTLIGSYNLGFKSSMLDYEVALVIDSPEITKKFTEVVEKDKKYSELISESTARGWYFSPHISYLSGIQKQFQGFM